MIWRLRCMSNEPFSIRLVQRRVKVAVVVAVAVTEVVDEKSNSGNGRRLSASVRTEYLKRVHRCRWPKGKAK